MQTIWIRLLCVCTSAKEGDSQSSFEQKKKFKQLLFITMELTVLAWWSSFSSSKIPVSDRQSTLLPPLVPGSTASLFPLIPSISGGNIKIAMKFSMSWWFSDGALYCYRHQPGLELSPWSNITLDETGFSSRKKQYGCHCHSTSIRKHINRLHTAGVSRLLRSWLESEFTIQKCRHV